MTDEGAARIAAAIDRLAKAVEASVARSAEHNRRFESIVNRALDQREEGVGVAMSPAQLADHVMQAGPVSHSRCPDCGLVGDAHMPYCRSLDRGGSA